jgi:hypothetical protein
VIDFDLNPQKTCELTLVCSKLVVFRDGSYLELIAFIDDDPKHREGHWWGDKGWGVIDFAFTLKQGKAISQEPIFVSKSTPR